MTVAAWEDLISLDPRRRERRVTPASEHPEAAWAQNPVLVVVNGVERELFGIGALAAALNRSARTVRRWEADGTIPPCRFWVQHHDPRGRRRRYTRDWIEGLVVIAADEGLLDRKSTPIESTEFPRRAFALRQRLLAG